MYVLAMDVIHLDQIIKLVQIQFAIIEEFIDKVIHGKFIVEGYLAMVDLWLVDHQQYM
jgi:hypothetical protein